MAIKQNITTKNRKVVVVTAKGYLFWATPPPLIDPFLSYVYQRLSSSITHAKLHVKHKTTFEQIPLFMYIMRHIYFYIYIYVLCASSEFSTFVSMF